MALLAKLALLSASGATYYVDFSAGADSNPGTAAAPFRHCPGDSNATGKAAITFATGDTVIFKGGVTYVGYINCPSNSVTYDGNSAGSFGTGRAVISGQNSTIQIKGLTANGRTGLIFNNLEMEDYGGHGSLPWTGMETSGYYGYGIYLDECSQTTVSNCYFHDMGDWQNVANANEGYMEGVGVAVIDSGSAITFTGNEFTRIGRAGIMIEPRLGTQICTNISVTHNNFHDYIRWGVWLSTGNTNCTLNGITIDGNQFHDFYQYATPNWLGLPNDAPHVDCIIAYIGSLPPQGGQILGTVANPITIRNNVFYNDATVAQVQNSAVFLDTFGGRVLIYNNVFVNVLYDGNGAIFCLEGTDTSINPAPDYWIANNSFYDSIYGVTLESDLYPIKKGSVHVLNNVFCKTDSGYGFSVRVMDANSTPTQIDYNIYSTGRSDNLLAVMPAGYENLSQLQALGYEAHGRQANPLYSDVSGGLGSASSTNNLHLQASSPAIGAGLNLSTLFTTDLDGQTRPASAAWDCGAFEWSATDANAGQSIVSSAASAIGAVVSEAVPVASSAAAAVTTTATSTSSSSQTTTATQPAVTTSSSTPSTPSSSPSTATSSSSQTTIATKPATTTSSSTSSTPSSSALATTSSSSQTTTTTQPVTTTSSSSSSQTTTATQPATTTSSSTSSTSPSSTSSAAAPSSATTVATQPVTASVPATSAPSARLVNLSAEASCSNGANALTAGFVISGGSKMILMRGIGPGLAAFGVNGVVDFPNLSVYEGSSLMGSNDKWNGASALQAAFTQTGAFALDPGSNDSALLLTLPSGAFTSEIVSGDGGTGVAMAEIYDDDTGSSPAGRLVNLSARAEVGAGGSTLTVGFVIAGTGSETVLIRGVGPSLAQYGVTGTLADPQINLYQASRLLQQNAGGNNLTTLSPIFAQCGAFPLTSTEDAVLVVTLPPGQYTAVLSGVSGDTGIGLAEIYELP